jgi:hypothetical protein
MTTEMNRADLRLAIFVEDPGAINCVVPIIEELARREFKPRLLLVHGLAASLLPARGFECTPVKSGVDAVRILLRASVDCVLLGTSENLDSPGFDLGAAARAAGVVTYAIVDAGVNAAYRFRGRSRDPLAHVPDYVLVPDEWTAEQFISLGLSSDRVITVGHPHHDQLRAMASTLSPARRAQLRSQLLPREAEGRSVLVFASEISTGLDPQQYLRSATYTLRGRGASAARTEIVAEELLDCISALERQGYPRPFLVLRRHPKESTDGLDCSAEFDFISSGDSAQELLRVADLVVGMTSMLLTEAHMLGIATLSILPRELERDWLNEVRTGQIPAVTNREELRKALATTIGHHARYVDHGPGTAVASLPAATRILDFIESTRSSARRGATSI